MSLIWADSFTGDRALAPAWQRYALAQAKADDTTLATLARVEAMDAAAEAKKRYEQLATQAEAALLQTAAGGKFRTHVLIAGVGAYDDNNIKAVTTSVHGASAFAEWMLARFQHTGRP